MSVERRIRKLKEAVGAGVPCEECSHVDGKPATDTLAFEVVWDYTGDEGPSEDEYCPACGQQLVYVVTWGAEEKVRFHAHDRDLRLVEDDRGEG